jgi:hypothetical protein
MAWRIHDSVIRGEIDNREKGVVRGHLWLDGLDGPAELMLRGNACKDLAGCLLTFENPLKTVKLPVDAGISPKQTGSIGDLTASRKVRVYDVPLDEAMEMTQQGQRPPEHLANCLYLEWFSDSNGRVVVESADYRLTISEPLWRLTPEEETSRLDEAAQGFTGFIGKLNNALEAAKTEFHEDKEWNEFDYEKFMKESDARTDKYMELVDKYQDHPDADAIIAQEMGWESTATTGEASRYDGEGEDDEGPLLDADEINRVTEEALDLEPDPATKGVDWIQTPDGDIRHPLRHRCTETSVRLWKKCTDLGLDQHGDADLHRFTFEFQCTGAKLAGALDGLAYHAGLDDPAFIVARLKRALDHLHRSLAGLEAVAAKSLIPAELAADDRAELFGIREEILRLMAHFRRGEA